jgi:hypothetical protein
MARGDGTKRQETKMNTDTTNTTTIASYSVPHLQYCDLSSATIDTGGRIFDPHVTSNDQSTTEL